MPIDSLLHAAGAVLLLAAGTGAALLVARPAPQHAYTVAELQAHLAAHTATWEGRVVRVRAMVLADCHSLEAAHKPPCGASLVDPGGASLPIVPAWQPDPLLKALRSIPVVGSLVPPAQVVRPGTMSVYRVLLKASPAAECSAAPCLQALLLDTTPDAP
jgi:hypothetical protein